MNAHLPTARDAATLAIAQEMCDLAAHLHAGTARLGRLAAEFDTAEGWTGAGMRSCVQWLFINTGHGPATGETLVRIGHALETLPLIAGAFAAGELSLDKVRELCRVATPADEDVWLEIARAASAAQLTRIVRAAHRCMEQADPDQAKVQRARRGLWIVLGGRRLPATAGAARTRGRRQAPHRAGKGAGHHRGTVSADRRPCG